MNMTDQQFKRFQELFASTSEALWQVGSEKPSTGYSPDCIHDAWGRPILDVAGAGTVVDAELAVACVNFVRRLMQPEAAK